jgi:hypothetical protein
MSDHWDNQPNRQKTVETTIPTLAGIMLGLVGALFVAAALTDVAMLKLPTDIYPVLFCEWWAFTIPGERRFLIVLLSAAPGLCFYRSIAHCVLSQMSFYNPNANDNPDVIPILPTGSQDDLEEWDAIRGHWEAERRKHAKNALLFFNGGINLLLLPLIFLLPPTLLTAGLYIWLISVVFFYKHWMRQQSS